jgi:hypothetical protein
MDSIIYIFSSYFSHNFKKGYIVFLAYLIEVLINWISQVFFSLLGKVNVELFWIFRHIKRNIQFFFELICVESDINIG